MTARKERQNMEDTKDGQLDSLVHKSLVYKVLHSLVSLGKPLLRLVA